jgi:hypothetical protein
MPVRIIHSAIPLADLQVIAAEQFGDMVKAVVDVGRRMMAIGGELHSDEESSRDVEDPELRERIRAIVKALIER